MMRTLSRKENEEYELNLLCYYHSKKRDRELSITSEGKKEKRNFFITMDLSIYLVNRRKEKKENFATMDVYV